MPIKRTRQTFWHTSDGKAHDTAAQAREHEKRLVLAQIILGCATAAEVVQALLNAPNLTIVLHEPRKERTT